MKTKTMFSLNPEAFKVFTVKTGKFSFHFNPKEGQCQRMFKLLHNCAHFTCQQGNDQNPSNQASAVCELRTSDAQGGFQKAEEPEIKLPTSTGSQKNKGIPEKHLLLLY